MYSTRPDRPNPARVECPKCKKSYDLWADAAVADDAVAQRKASLSAQLESGCPKHSEYIDFD